MNKLSKLLNKGKTFFLKSPKFPEDDIKTSQSEVLNFILLSYWLIIIITILLLIFSSHRIGAEIILGLFIIILIVIEFLKYYRQVLTASAVLIASMWILTTILNISEANAINIFSIWFVPIIITTGLLLGRKTAYFITALTILTTLVLLYVNRLHLINGPYFITVPVTNWVIFFIALIQTVAPVNLMIQSLNKSTFQLEEKVQERTTELNLTKKELELYMYSLSHDLKNPIENIYGLVKLLKTIPGNTESLESQEILEKISLNSSRMVNLTKEFLQFFTTTKNSVSKKPLKS